MLEIFVNCVCVLHRPETFGRKHSLVAHRHQFKAQTLGDRVGSRVKGSGPDPSLSWKYVAELYICCTCIEEMAPRLPVPKYKKENCASTSM